MKKNYDEWHGKITSVKKSDKLVNIKVFFKGQGSNSSLSVNQEIKGGKPPTDLSGSSF